MRFKSRLGRVGPWWRRFKRNGYKVDRCDECGKWHNCIHTPLTAIRALLTPPPPDATPDPVGETSESTTKERG